MMPMFYPTDHLPMFALLEKHWRAIRAECMALPHHEFTAWPERALYSHGWDVYGLYANMQMLLENCIFCPFTSSLLASLSGVVNAGFSRMAAGTHIHPHVGYTGTVLRLHLALQANGHCGLRVGQERRNWQEGHCLLFDDTVEHEAWNNSTRDRLVLLVDFARPAVLGAA